MRNGLYHVDFQTPRGAGAGVIVLIDGKLRGGDSALYYQGSYAVSGNNVTAQVKTGRHSQMLPSVFGIDVVTISLTGTVSGDSAQMRGQAAEVPGVSFQAKMTRIGD